MLTGRVFLDTSILNIIINHREQIFDGYSEIDGISDRLQQDIYAIYQILISGQHTGLDVVISPLTFQEILATIDDEKRGDLYQYCVELRHYFQDNLTEQIVIPLTEARLIQDYLEKGCLSLLPGKNDRRLIIEALYYKCDYFCTRDWKTILKHRDKLKSIPMQFITPSEWWQIPKEFS